MPHGGGAIPYPDPDDCVPLTDEQLKSVLKTIDEAGEYITFSRAGVKVA